MSVHERRLAIACRETRQGVIRLINLVEGRAAVRSAQRSDGSDLALLDELNRYLRRTEDLSEAALRAPCLGVVGMAGSGAGALAEALVAVSADQGFAVHTAAAVEPFAYASTVAPPETPLGRAVTQRFQSRASSNSARMPLALALLKPIDVAMVLVRLHATSVARAKDVHLDTEDLRRSVIALGEHLGLFAVPGMTSSDIFTIRDHVNGLYGTRQASRALEAAGYWQSVAAMITHLPNSARGRLLAPLWGGMASLTAIFVELMDALDGLGYADEVLAPLEAVARVERGSQAIVQRTDSIVVGETARGFASGDTEALDVQTRSRHGARITRSALAALTHEIRWHVKSRPGSLLSRCDILQMPELPLVTRSLEATRTDPGSDAMSAAFHSAKVTHIFRRAALGHELTALVAAVDLAARPSHRLAPIVAEWVSLAQGAEMSERAETDTALVIALTNAAVVARDVTDPADWDGYIDGALDTVLGVVDQAGAQHWVPGRGFDHVALVQSRAAASGTGDAIRRSTAPRDPSTVKPVSVRPAAKPWFGSQAASVATRTSAAAMTGGDRSAPSARAIADERAEPDGATEAMEAMFLASASVRASVRNPYAAWTDLTAPAGGVDRVLALIEPAADAIVKQRHVAEDLASTSRELKYLVERHLHRAQSLYGRLNRRHREALVLVTRLRRPDVQARLGSLLKALQLGEGELTDALYNFEMRPRVDLAPEPASTAVSANIARRSIGDGRAPSGLDSVSFAAAAIGHWFNRLRTVARSPEMSQAFHIPRDSLLTLSEELIAGATRTSIVERLARRVEPFLLTSDDPHGRASMVALQAVEIIGSTITELDGGRVPAVRDDHWRRNLPAPPGSAVFPIVTGAALVTSHGTGGAGDADADGAVRGGRSRSLEERVCRFHDTWCLAFLELVRRNASEGPRFDAAVDGKEELGDLLKLFSFYAVEWGL